VSVASAWQTRIVPTTGFVERVVVEPLHLYFRYLGVSIRGQMQYRASFVLSVLGQFFITGIEFLGVWALFDRFGTLETWTLPEVALFYGVVNVSFAIADALSTGFDQFATYVKTGVFDRLLVRPRSTVLQLAGVELALRRIGRLSQGLLILGWASFSLDVVWTPGSIGLLLFSLVGGACLFFGLFVVQATICFFTTESLELMNTMTYGGVESAQYPIAIYAPWFRRFFTFVVPLACVSYFPILAILERPDPLGTPFWFQCASPAAGLLFLAAAILAWRFGVRRYTSTGS
jgi:ABC-2 type transport system permease protein